jgi:hypothetical protein
MGAWDGMLGGEYSGDVATDQRLRERVPSLIVGKARVAKN